MKMQRANMLSIAAIGLSLSGILFDVAGYLREDTLVAQAVIRRDSHIANALSADMNEFRRGVGLPVVQIHNFKELVGAYLEAMGADLKAFSDSDPDKNPAK